MEIKRSVFYGFAAPVTTEASALEFIAQIKAKYPDAKHHVYAYSLREGHTTRYSDDHEPQGTAGMPVLDALRKNDCVDAIIVVVRYFGGTLLGTGGLVRAYTAAATEALQNASPARRMRRRLFLLHLPYNDYRKAVNSLFSEEGYHVHDTVFGERVDVKISVPYNQADSLIRCCADMSAGRISCEELEEFYGF